MADTAASTEPYAVIRTTSTSGATCLMAGNNSSPVVPGIMRSVRTTSTLCERTCSSARFASKAVSTRIPSRRKIFSSDSTFERSSSTTSTVVASALGSGMGAPGGDGRGGEWGEVGGGGTVSSLVYRVSTACQTGVTVISTTDEVAHIATTWP